MPPAHSAAEIAYINPESLGFSALGPRSGGSTKKVQLLPSPWTKDRLPPSSASLLAVASGAGLIAAAGPDVLIIASTEATRKAFHGEADENGVITDFTPDLTIPIPQLRHLAFSSGEDFLVISAENGGGLAVYSVLDLVEKKHNPTNQISTEQVSVRALVPNPAQEFEHYFAVVLDSGKLLIADILDGRLKEIHPSNVACVAWSVKGKAVIAGMNDGTAVQYMSNGSQMGTIPRPPDVDESFSMSAVYWLTLTEFFTVHSLRQAPVDGMEEDSIYHIVKTDKARSAYTFHRSPGEICFPGMGAPERSLPLRFSITRLREWKPDLDDLLILTTSNSTDIAMLTRTSAIIAPDQTDEGALHDYTITQLLDNRRAQLPQITGEMNDSIAIGEALDLSSKEKISGPIPMMEEIEESPTPLPAFLVLNHQGILSAWWIVWDKSIMTGTGYPGLMALREGAESATPAASTTPAAQTSSIISQPMFGAPLANQASSTPTGLEFGKPTPPSNSFGVSSTPTFGGAGVTAFGKPSFGAPSAIGTPGLGKPAFGAPSAIGAAGAPGFGMTGGIGASQSPWGSSAQKTSSQTPQNPFASAAGGASGFSQVTQAQPKLNPFASVEGGALGSSKPSETPHNPFASVAGGASGFAKFGDGKPAAVGSSFSSFGSANGGSSPFSNLGTQKSAFSGTTNEPSAFKGANMQPSFGSTVTVDSGVGSTLPSWANTPAKQGSSVFEQNNSSFVSTTSTKESDMSDATDAQNRERDEATPTPQAPKNIFSLPSNGFKLNSTFQGDGSAKDDLPKPSASTGSSMFGDEFASTLGGSSSKTPATPVKQEEQEIRLQDISTTPASPPRQSQPLFPTTTPAKAPPVQKETPVIEDAPLPPDPMTWKPPKAADDEPPPLAGSPGVQVEAPESSVPSSPLDDDEDDFLVEEHDGDNEEEEPSPSDAARKSRTPKTGFSFQDSNRFQDSGRFFPPAPTPPVQQSRPPSQSGRSTSPARPLRFTPTFNPTPKPATSSAFTSSATPGPFPKFPPPSNRNKDIRSPSPVRPGSTSTVGTQPQHVIAPRTSLRQSMQQQPKPPTPQPEVSDLSDDEDERIRQELAREIVPRRTLDPFIAHQDYTGSSLTKTGHAAQIEIIYRDINSMVDTLGLNSRSLAAFIKYHSKARQSKLTRTDLEEVEHQGEGGPWYDEWCISEIKDLTELETELEDELNDGRVQDVVDKLGQLVRLLREKAKLMTKLNDIRRQIIIRKDPEKAEALRKASLPKELADQQKVLRTEYARLLSLLGQSEEATMLLRSKLASHGAENGKTGAVPTVDAVKKTIVKMIALTEKKNSEIVLLEAQLRKIGIGEGSRPASSSSRNFGTPSRSRALRGQSPFATPPTSKSTKMSLSELNRRAMTPEVEETTPSRGYGLFYTPEGSPTPGDSLVRLANKMDDDTLVGLREMAERRKKLAQGLANAVLKRGVKVTSIG
ncbi:hypothetical protein K505DRAFT_360589 [Melanomma pulvis-pyrius CBS 109.77]|uniref:Nucleoporin Nup159/Nup146 N-terminal domain-containing protein n=1 Tax=Melanomma pulvis-pyrius CBS 109.77 TaxID=1314802 RepID=A0A6A6XG21_9PLEO|nr:hypothetical protein K505DRAFT_360589 [Melanomma pulvis-pyrius CBS 109.77]